MDRVFSLPTLRHIVPRALIHILKVNRVRLRSQLLWNQAVPNTVTYFCIGSPPPSLTPTFPYFCNPGVALPNKIQYTEAMAMRRNRELKEINNHPHPTAGYRALVGTELERNRKV